MAVRYGGRHRGHGGGRQVQFSDKASWWCGRAERGGRCSAASSSANQGLVCACDAFCNRACCGGGAGEDVAFERALKLRLAGHAARMDRRLSG